MRGFIKKSGRMILRGVALIAAIPIIYKTAVVTFPHVQAAFEKPALAVAGFSLLGGTNANNNSDMDFVIPPNEITTGQNDAFNYINEPVIRVPAEIKSNLPEQNANASQSATPIKPVNAGVVTRKTYAAGNTSVYIPLKDGYIKNCTSLSQEKIKSTVSKTPKFKIKADNTPEVLIMHTHATESYQDTEKSWYDKSYNCRTTDNTKNMVSVGDKIQKQLEAAGIGVIHDKTQHDYPSYNGAYERSAVTVKRILKENPSIKVVLDVHRDAIQPDSNTMVAPVTTINGKKSAQVMIISGCDNGKLNIPNYLENLKFSAALQQQMEGDYSTLTRPILFDYRKYNQDLTTGSILIEVGGHANTLEEAQFAGELIGASLSKVLLGLK